MYHLREHSLTVSLPFTLRWKKTPVCNNKLYYLGEIANNRVKPIITGEAKKNRKIWPELLVSSWMQKTFCDISYGSSVVTQSNKSHPFIRNDFLKLYQSIYGITGNQVNKTGYCVFLWLLHAEIQSNYLSCSFKKVSHRALNRPSKTLFLHIKN